MVISSLARGIAASTVSDACRANAVNTVAKSMDIVALATQPEKGLLSAHPPRLVLAAPLYPQRYNWPQRPAGGNKPNLRVFSFSDAFRLPINVCD